MRSKFKRIIFLTLIGVMLLSMPIVSYATEMDKDATGGEGSEGTQQVFDGASHGS